jgi:hypothetical protein
MKCLFLSSHVMDFMRHLLDPNRAAQKLRLEQQHRLNGRPESEYVVITAQSVAHMASERVHRMVLKQVERAGYHDVAEVDKFILPVNWSDSQHWVCAPYSLAVCVCVVIAVKMECIACRPVLKQIADPRVCGSSILVPPWQIRRRNALVQ